MSVALDRARPAAVDGAAARGVRPESRAAPRAKPHQAGGDATGGRARRAIESEKREKPPRGLPRAVFEFGSR
jgi:hypothetical protein